jgi:Dyp-type peroxidase family
MDEPIVDVDEIQANVWPGFKTKYMRVDGFELGDGGDVRAWLDTLAAEVTWAAQVDAARGVRPLVNVCLSHRALQELGAPADEVDDAWFRRGLRAFAGRLGEAPPRFATPDILLLVGDDDQTRANRAADALMAAAPASLRHIPYPAGERLERDSPGRAPDAIEHFGFRDGISNPAIRGRYADGRDLCPRSDPPQAGFGRRGQVLVWPGQAFFGYPGQRVFDAHEPGATVTGGAPWLRNCSFLVFRVFKQDVKAFRDFTDAIDAQEQLPAGRTAAMLVGRWPNGTPLVRYPDAPGDPDDERDNDFAYFAAAADANGAKCPFVAHIRKVNPRDAPTDSGDGPATLAKQIFRRGITWGKPFEQDSHGERGLLFMAYATEIERRFGALSTWMDTSDGPEGKHGTDLLVGGAAGERWATLPIGEQGKRTLTPPRWIEPAGGGFFLSPSRELLKRLASAGP